MTLSEIDAHDEKARAFIRAVADRDMETKLDSDGVPRHPGNDYELHLYARKLRLNGWAKEQIRDALAELIATTASIPANKIDKYLSDIVNSIIVGFPGED